MMSEKSESDGDSDIRKSDEEDSKDVITEEDAIREKKIPEVVTIEQRKKDEQNVTEMKESVEVHSINIEKYFALFQKIAEQEFYTREISSDDIEGSESLSKEKSETGKTTFSSDSKTNFIRSLRDSLEYENAKNPTNQTVLVEVSVILISGELQVQVRKRKIVHRILKMDSGESETKSDKTDADFVILNPEDQEELKDESMEENEESEKELEVDLPELKETELSTEPETMGEKEKLSHETADDIIADDQKKDEYAETSFLNLSNVKLINIITDLIDLKHRTEHNLSFATVWNMKQFIVMEFLNSRYLYLFKNLFDIKLNDDDPTVAEIAFVKALYESTVRAVLFYSRINGFLILQCIVDNPSFDTNIYQEIDVKSEISFLKSVYDEAGLSKNFQKQRSLKEFIACSFLFNIVQFIEKNQINKLLEWGVVQTTEPYDHSSDSNVFSVKPENVEKLYEMDQAIIVHFDLLADFRFFTTSLQKAQRTLKLKPLVFKYGNIQIQLPFFKLLIKHTKRLSITNLDNLLDWKLSSEEDQKDHRCFNALQAQQMIRNEYWSWKGSERLARKLACQLIFYCESDWFWSEIVEIMNVNMDLPILLTEAFRFLPILIEYLVKRREPKNKTSLNLYHFINEFLMVVPHEEFINRHYNFFITQLCKDFGCYGSILNPAIVFNQILIPNLKVPIRKICAAVTIMKMLETREVNINWSFDYTSEYKHYNKDANETIDTEKVEAIQLIGALYSQYILPDRNTIRASRYYYIDSVLTKLQHRLAPFIGSSFTENALKYLDELVAKKKFNWQADYYLSKIILRKILAGRKVEIPPRPTDERNEQAQIQWISDILPIAFAGVKLKPFLNFVFLTRGVNHLHLECAFILRFNDIPEFCFIECLILFKILSRCDRNYRYRSFCNQSLWSYGERRDKGLLEIVKWMFNLINRVQLSGKINNGAILTAKHRMLHWAEAYVAKCKILGSDDARGMLRLLGWKNEPGLKDDELERGMSRLFYEVHQKCVIRPHDSVFEMVDKWIPCGRSPEELEDYLTHIPPSRPSEVKVYKPTRLLIYRPVRRNERTPLEQCRVNKFINDTIDFHEYGGGSRMPNRPRSGPGMYGYARPMYLWSVDGFKWMPYSALKNKYETVPSDLSKLFKKKKIPFDLRAEVGSEWHTIFTSSHHMYSRPKLQKKHLSKSINLPIYHEKNNEIARIETPYDPLHPYPWKAYDNELDIGASAATFKKDFELPRCYSLPNDLSSLNLKTEKIIPKWSTLRTMGQRNIELSDEEMEHNYLRCVYPEEFKEERIIFHPFVKNNGSCSTCGLIDHTEDFCPEKPGYSSLLKKLLPMTYKWNVKKEKAFGNLHRQDSWGCFDDDDH